MKKVLIIPSSGIGNFLLSIPLIEYLSRTCETDVIIPKSVTVLAQRLKGKYFNQIITNDGSFFSLYNQISKTKYDVAYYCFPAHRNKYLLLLYFVRVNKVLGYRINRAKRRLYFLHPNFKRYSEMQNEAVMNLRLAKPDADLDYIKKNKHKYLLSTPIQNKIKNQICLHPGAGTKGNLGQLKKWPISHWNKLIDELNKLNEIKKILILIGPAEHEVREKIKRNNRVEFIETGLTDLIEILSRSKFYIGNDNGISHLAAFCGIPSFTLFGPSNQTKNHPLFNEDKVIRKDIFCSPCQKLIGETHCNNFEYKKCLDSLYPEHVYDFIRNHLL